MFVFIAHAEADQAAADDLKAFLKARGLTAETETGGQGFRHLQASDVVIAPWSQKSAFARHRMQIERRMLDAWADQQLVLVKLDNAFLPVGMRDLSAIDASFEQSRALTAWPQVEQAVRASMKRAQADRPRVEGIGAASDSSGGLRSRMHDFTAPGDSSTSIQFGGSSPQPAAMAAPSPSSTKYSARPRAAPAKSRRRFPWITLLVIAALGGGAAWYMSRSGKLAAPAGGLPGSGVDGPAWIIGPEGIVSLPVAIGAGGLIAVLLLVIVIRGFGSRRGSSSSAKPSAKPSAKKKAEAPIAARMANRATPATPAPPPVPSMLFVSYAHADNAAVEPVVAIVEKSGQAIWIDKTGIQTGDDWAGEIVRAIKAAKGIIVMCSKQAFESDHVKREIYLADRYKKPMSPVFIEAAQPPEDFEYFFAGVQWLELYKLPEDERAAAIGRALRAV